MTVKVAVSVGDSVAEGATVAEPGGPVVPVGKTCVLVPNDVGSGGAVAPAADVGLVVAEGATGGAEGVAGASDGGVGEPSVGVGRTGSGGKSPCAVGVGVDSARWPIVGDGAGVSVGGWL